MPLRYGGVAWLRNLVSKISSKIRLPYGGLILRYGPVTKLRYGASAMLLSGHDCVMANAIPTFQVAQDGLSITFQPCGTTSYHPDDIKNRYCPLCHRFIGDLLRFRIDLATPKEDK